MKILQMGAASFDDRCWQAYYLALGVLEAKDFAPYARIGWEATRDRFLSLLEVDSDYYRFVIFDSNTVVGWGELTIQKPGTSEQNAAIRLESVFTKENAEFNRVCGVEFLRLMEEREVKLAHTMSRTQLIADISRSWFSEGLNRLERFRLMRADANVDLMRSWVEEFPQANPDLRLEFFSPVPEEHFEKHVETFVQYVREMPSEHEGGSVFQMSVAEARRTTKWRLEHGAHLYTTALFNSAGDMIGHSNAHVTDADPRDAFQAITGLDKAYRGRGLSRWLKAVIFFKIGEDYPENEYMTTDMRASNAPIQSVNAQMGYKLLNEGYEFEVTQAGLRKFVSA